MLSWKDIVEKYIVRHSDRIRKATQPLRDHFGIEYFTYHQIDSNGKYTVLVDRPDWAERYVGEQIYLHDPYLRHPSRYQNGICTIDSHGTKEYRDQVVKETKEVLNSDIGTIFIQKTDTYVEFFGFAASKKKSAIEKIYFNHPHIFQSFGNFFKRECTSILTQMKQEANSLINLKGDDFLCKQSICPTIDPEIRLGYYQDIGTKCDADKAEKLTPRERQCLRLLLKEKTAKETASELGISSRTVEYYFEIIKRKWSCWNKQQLLKIARNLDAIGLL